jgi:hypothetical protein
MKKHLVTFYILLCPFFFQESTLANKNSDSLTIAEQKQAQLAAVKLHQTACSISPYISDDPWHIANLYNCANKQLFIPYQLWTGSKWNGDKNATCMHKANTRSPLENSKEGYFGGEVIINGPIKWKDDLTGEVKNVWQRTRSNTKSNKYYICHNRGIGGIHNLNKPWVKWIRGLCNIPAGYGWQIGKKRTCIKTTLEIIDIQLDEKNHLKNITVKFWFRDKLLYRYVYERNFGTKSIFNYSIAKP